MLMFWDALREAARRRQDKKSNIPSPNDCFSAKQTKTEFYSFLVFKIAGHLSL